MRIQARDLKRNMILWAPDKWWHKHTIDYVDNNDVGLPNGWVRVGFCVNGETTFTSFVEWIEFEIVDPKLMIMS
jgi:hypothetical protein